MDQNTELINDAGETSDYDSFDEKEYEELGEEQLEMLNKDTKVLKVDFEAPKTAKYLRESNKINIVVSGDSNVHLAICALINSIFYNNERNKERLQIFIVTDTINIYNKLTSVCGLKHTLAQMQDLTTDTGGVKIIIPPPALMEFLGAQVEKFVFYSNPRTIDTRSFKPNKIMNIIRFYFPKLLPKYVNKVIYLDTDMIVKGDMNELYNSLPKHKDIGAVYSKVPYKLSTRRWIVNKALRQGMRSVMFNGGMYITHLNVWRQKDLTEKCMKLLLLNTKARCVYLGQTQPIMNIIFKEAYPLEQKWNQTGIGESRKIWIERTKEGEETLKDSINNASILHWTGCGKPWKYKRNSSEFKLFNCNIWTKYYYLNKDIEDLMKALVKQMVKTDIQKKDVKEFKKEIMMFPLPKNSIINCLNEDCAYIYSMIRYFKPKNILEIGTGFGKNLYGIIKACIKNKKPYHIHTIDNTNKCLIDRRILKNVTMHKGEVHAILKKAVGKLDFIIINETLSSRSAKLLNKVLNPKTIVCALNFVAPISDGLKTIYNVVKNTKLNKSVLIKPSHFCNKIYQEASNDYTKLDEVSERYVTQNPEILGNLKISHGEAQLNNSYAILLPRIYSDTLDIHFLEDCIDTIILAKNIDYSKTVLRTYDPEEDVFFISYLKNGLPIFENFGEKEKKKKIPMEMEKKRANIQERYQRRRRWRWKKN